jgi:hypothetical protein
MASQSSDGGTPLVAPDGSTIIESVLGTEGLIAYEIDRERVRQGRKSSAVIIIGPTFSSFRFPPSWFYPRFSTRKFPLTVVKA